MEETMFELITEKKKIDEKLNDQMIKLGWFFFEGFNLKGDHSKIMRLLEKLNPEYVTNQKELYDEICILLEVKIKKQENTPFPKPDQSEPESMECKARTENTAMENNDEVSWYSKADGIIKIINENDFKLVICSTDVPDHLIDRAKMNKFPMRILDNVTLDTINNAEKEAREANTFWAE